jgi:TRAP-type C4-dicarboxylate transport system permease small subunit
MTWLQQLDQRVAWLLKWVVLLCFFGLFVLLAFGIVQRSFPDFSISGYEELIDLLFVWLGFAGTAALWREGALYRVGAFDNLWSPGVRRCISLLIHVLMLSLLWVLVVYGYNFAVNAGETTPFLQVNKLYWYMAIPINSALMTVYSLAAMHRLWQNPAYAEHQEMSTLG